MQKQNKRHITQMFLNYFPYWQEVRLLPEEKQILIMLYGLQEQQPYEVASIKDVTEFEIEEIHMYKSNGLSKLIHYNKDNPPTIKDFTQKIKAAKKLDYLQDYPNWEKANLTDKEKTVFMLYMGINNKPYSYQEIADQLNITKQAAANLGKKAFVKIESNKDCNQEYASLF